MRDETEKRIEPVGNTGKKYTIMPRDSRKIYFYGTLASEALSQLIYSGFRYVQNC